MARNHSQKRRPPFYRYVEPIKELMHVAEACGKDFERYFNAHLIEEAQDNAEAMRDCFTLCGVMLRSLVHEVNRLKGELPLFTKEAGEMFEELEDEFDQIAREARGALDAAKRDGGDHG